MTLGKRLKYLRNERNLSLRKLAHEAGISPSYLSHLETDKVSNPSLEILCKLSASLRTTLAYLCYGEINIDLDLIGELPEGMQEFIDENRERLGLQNEDIIDLIGMKLRGNQPHTAEGWAYLHSSMNLIIEKGL